jgi:hypothetical protein
MNSAQRPPAPLFRDPIFDGAADPVVVYNRQERAWWILYTNRRANVPCRGVAWVHGTDIGVASSTDGGNYWLYRGILSGFEFEPGRNSFWAPEIFWHGDRYHMYMSYVRGIPHTWYGERHIIHYTSSDLWNWQKQSILQLSSDRVIDAAVHQLPNGSWRMWYKDEAHHSHTYAADSDDLYHWTVIGPVITDRAHEGPNVFFWRNSYWMVTDAWHGLAVYRSPDLEQWTHQSVILDTPGQRLDDGAMGRHADVVVQGDEAYIFYFTHPDRDETKPNPREETHAYADKRSSIQVARLGLEGEQLVCNRDQEFAFHLAAPAP